MGDEQSSTFKRKSQIRSLGSSFLGTYSEAPQYLRRNDFIIGGYRIGFNSPKKVIKSLFIIHNETVNIWTHLLGAIIFIFLIFEGVAYKMEQSHVLRKVINDDILTEQVTITDGTIPTWPIMASLIGASICLSCSTVFHWINPINQKVFKSLLRLDLAGVGINMVFMPIPAFYYSLYCNWQVAKFYISINVILGITSFVSNMFDWIHRKENMLLRFSILTLSTICSIFGVIHMLVSQLYFNNYGDTYSLVPSLYFYGPAVMCLVLGFIFFISRCPQRSHPGRYDICGHSHQIWHVLIFLGIAFSYLGSIVSYEMRSLHSSCPAPHEPFQ